jgi:hypothetical protein
MTHLPLRSFLLGSLTSLALLGCGGAPPSDPELTCDTGASALTMTKDVQPVLAAACVKCHEANYSFGDYTTAAKSHATLVGKTSLYAGKEATLKVVDPRNLANSSLWLKVLGGEAANRNGPKGEKTLGAMPFDGTTLSAAQKKVLKDWICSGAAL